MNPTTVHLNRANLIAQGGLDNAWVDLDLSVEDADEVFKIGADVSSGKYHSVEDFDLMFGNGWPRYGIGKGESPYVVLDLLGGRGIGEEELIHVIGNPLDKLFERDIFPVWRVEAVT